MACVAFPWVSLLAGLALTASVFYRFPQKAWPIPVRLAHTTHARPNFQEFVCISSLQLMWRVDMGDVSVWIMALITVS